MDAAENLGDTKVGNFEMALAIQKEVLEFDVAMCDSVLVQIGHAMQQLFEQAHLILPLERVSLHKREEVSVTAVLHHMVPSARRAAETNGFDDIRMIEAVSDAEFRLDLLLIFLFVFVPTALAKFLDGIMGIPGRSPTAHDLHRRGGTSPNLLAPTAGQSTRTHELLTQITGIDMEVVRKTSAHPACLEPDPRIGRDGDPRPIGLVLDIVQARRPDPSDGTRWAGRRGKLDSLP